MPSQSIVINTTPERAFSYVSDISRHGEWGNAQHKLEIKKTSEGPLSKGSTFASVGHQFGRNEDSVTIVEYEPNQKVAYEASGSAGLIKHAFEIKPAAEGITLIKSFEMVNGKFPFNVFYPIVAKPFVLPNALKGDLERIKQKLEQG